MDRFRDNSVGGIGGSGGFEESLRVIARLPAPEGLEERVMAGVRAGRGARVLEFPAALRPGSNWMRSAAAAAIVFVVAGGGWGVYTRVQKPQAAKVITMPVRTAAPGGFSNAGAMRTPNTLNGPVVTHPVVPKPVQAGVVGSAPKKVSRKAGPTVVGKTAAQPSAVAK
jgi:hypothetical protein